MSEFSAILKSEIGTPVTNINTSEPTRSPPQTMEAYATTTSLILLDIPPQTSFTLDTHVFTSTPQFRGIKYLDQGIHLLTYSLDKSDLGMRTGIFFQAHPGDVLAYKWDTQTEQLTRIQEHLQPAELIQRTPFALTPELTIQGLQSLHPYLTTVPDPSEDEKTTWKELTSYITVD